jgi:predicted phage gp36 major capsid-like protein
MEMRFSAMNRKIDVNVEALRSDIQTVAESVTALTAEMRRTTEAMRKEHAADREILRQSLLNHAERLHSLESVNNNSR